MFVVEHRIGFYAAMCKINITFSPFTEIYLYWNSSISASKESSLWQLNFWDTENSACSFLLSKCFFLSPIPPLLPLAVAADETGLALVRHWT